MALKVEAQSLVMAAAMFFNTENPLCQAASEPLPTNTLHEQCFFKAESGLVVPLYSPNDPYYEACRITYEDHQSVASRLARGKLYANQLKGYIPENREMPILLTACGENLPQSAG